MMFNVAMLVPSTDGVLTDPGPLCAGQTATLTCNITGGVFLEWNYVLEGENGRIPTYDSARNVFPPSGPVERGGVEFTVTLQMPTSPHLVSQISFTASAGMNGRQLDCVSIVGTTLLQQNTILQVVTGN